MKRLILLALLFVIACNGSPDERSILDRSNCVLPCWNGIVAGQTTENEILKILGTLPDIDQQSIQITNEPWNIFDNQIFFSFRQGWALEQRPKLRGYADITDGIVSALMFCGDINTTMETLVEAVGQPENLISGNDMDGSRTVILIYASKGISYSYTTERNNLEISPNTKIDCVEIFDPSLYDVMLEAKFFSSGAYNAEETLKVQYPWDGYGNLDEKYPPRQP